MYFLAINFKRVNQIEGHMLQQLPSQLDATAHSK